MIITCAECNSSFSVSDGLIKDTGSKVRCSKCDSVFVAYPQSTEDIEKLETSEVELTLDSEDLKPAEDKDWGLDDLDSDLGDFLDDDEADETFAMSTDIEESELDLNDFDDTLDAGLESEPDDVLEETKGELELDLDFDEDDDSDLMMDEESIGGDDLPDLEDLADLDEAESTTDEADSELEGLDFELESETDAELDLEGDDGLDLTDLGLEEEDIPALGDPSAEQDGALEVEESDELDLSDLEIAIDEESAPEETAGADAEDLSFDLEMDEPEVAEIAAAGLEVGASDELDLSDLELEIDAASASEETSAAGSEGLDLDLDLEAETVAGSQEGATDELDLSDLPDILENEGPPATEAQPEGLDLDLELESEASTGADEPAAVADSGDIDELDLSDLEDFIETEDVPAAQAAADDSAQDLDMDLDFQLDDGAPTTESAADSQDDDELDFSDLEQMLESDETPSVEATDSNHAQDLDLQLDLDEPSTAGADAAAAADPGATAQDDDFLDIEELLEEGEASEPLEGAGLNGDVTDLPLDMEAALDDASKGADAELELDFDLESELQAKEDEDPDFFDTSESTDNQLESNLLASDEVDFLEAAEIDETEFQDSSQTSVISTDEFASDELSGTDSDFGATHVLPGSESDLPIAESLTRETVLHVPPKARSKKPVFVVVLLFLLAIGVIIVPNMVGIKIPYISDIKIPYLSDLDVKIPYLSDWLNPAPQDVAGNLKIIPLGNTINGEFVDNSKSGRLYVIQGQLRNDYDHPRSYIKVTGKLFYKGKKISKSTTVYCGNMLSNSNLAAMDITAISKRLRNRSGDKKSNFKVKTGKRVPFMIVFDKLPRNLDEFTVEVEGSSI
jgi:predicted Zn finger-like uncharacterized protein